MAVGRYTWNAEDEALISKLSPSLRMEMRQAIFVPMLLQIPLFADQEAFARELAMCVQMLCVLEGDLIVHRGELGANEMFMVVTGAVRVFGNSFAASHVIRAADPCPLFGLYELRATEEEERKEHRSVVRTTSPISRAWGGRTCWRPWRSSHV